LKAEALRARVAALRKLATQDVVPAVQDVVQDITAGAEIELKRMVLGPGRLVGYTKPLRLRFEPAVVGAPRVSEAAVVLGATMARMPAATWRGAHIVELGCGMGYIGVLLAALGGHVSLTDLPTAHAAAMGSIAMNAPTIRAGGSASFYALDWAQPQNYPDALSTLARASIVVASDPADTHETQESFLHIVKAMFGIGVEVPLCRNLQMFLMAHKHQQNYCIAGYSAPSADSRPTISLADERGRCLLRHGLEDAGLSVNDWQQPPKEFAHPFVELWMITRRA